MFESAFLKVERARSHIEELELRVKEFVSREPYRTSIKQRQDGGVDFDLELREPIPPVFGLAIGDAAHNLRSALDHATWELIGLDNGGAPDPKTKLPSGRDKTSFEAFCRGMKTPRDDTKEFFCSLGIYDGGNEALYALNQLNNIDKHRILVPHFAAAAIEHLRVVGGGMDMVMTNCTIGARPDGTVGLGSFGPGTKVIVDEDAKLAAAIFFAQGQPMAGEPVAIALHTLRTHVQIALTDFRNFVAQRV